MNFQGHVENGVIVLDGAVNLPNGVQVRVEIIPTELIAKNSESVPCTQFNHYESIIGAITDLPEDFASQHDHYIHGIPKQ